MMERFCENRLRLLAVNNFSQNLSIINFRLGSKYASDINIQIL